MHRSLLDVGCSYHLSREMITVGISSVSSHELKAIDCSRPDRELMEFCMTRKIWPPLDL